MKSEKNTEHALLQMNDSPRLPRHMQNNNNNNFLTTCQLFEYTLKQF